MQSGDKEVSALQAVLKALAPLNRTIVSDDMDRAADLLDEAVGFPAARYQYPSGAEYGSWVVPPSWNVREAFLSDGEKVIASYQDHALFLAPYSPPFEGWVSREDLLEHTFVSEVLDDAFAYQHRIAADYQKRLKRWEISLPRGVISKLLKNRYFVKIDVDVRPGTMNVLEYTVKGAGDKTVGLLTHLCHPGQVNDGLSGVLAGIALLRRLAAGNSRFTYKLLVMPETFGSVIHVIAQGLSARQFCCAAFLETMACGERLYLKRSRTGNRPIDLAVESLARERPEIGVHNFFEGYGNDELIFDFANVGIPAISVQYYPFVEYHTSRDNLEIFDWEKWTRAVDLTWELFRRLEADRIIQLKYPGPPYLTRYRLYADAVTERARWRQISDLLALCDGQHSILQMCAKSGLPFHDVSDFFGLLDREGLLLKEPHIDHGSQSAGGL